MRVIGGEGMILKCFFRAHPIEVPFTKVARLVARLFERR